MVDAIFVSRWGDEKNNCKISKINVKFLTSTIKK